MQCCVAKKSTLKAVACAMECNTKRRYDSGKVSVANGLFWQFCMSEIVQRKGFEEHENIGLFKGER